MTATTTRSLARRHRHLENGLSPTIRSVPRQQLHMGSYVSVNVCTRLHPFTDLAVVANTNTNCRKAPESNGYNAL